MTLPPPGVKVHLAYEYRSCLEQGCVLPIRDKVQSEQMFTAVPINSTDRVRLREVRSNVEGKR